LPKTIGGRGWILRIDTDQLNAIAEGGKDLPDSIVDGEIVALDGNGSPNFAGLQATLSDGKTNDLMFFAFDLLFDEGEELRKCRYPSARPPCSAYLPRMSGTMRICATSSTSRPPAIFYDGAFDVTRCESQMRAAHSATPVPARTASEGSDLRSLRCHGSSTL
jgi:hypothetical protein